MRVTSRRRHTLALLTGASLLALTSNPSLAENGFAGLGDLADGLDWSVANDVSGDGSAVVGDSYAGSSLEAFLWTESAGIVGLGDLPGGSVFSRASSVNTDGSVVVGHSESANGGEAFRWTQSGGMVGLGALTGMYFNSYAAGVSGDGLVVVGSSVSNWFSEAFRWTEAGGMVGLGDIPGGSSFSEAKAVNADGSVVVGYGYSASGGEAFRWTESGGMVGLGDLAGGSYSSQANGVSDDGSVVIGLSYSANGREAFRWTEASGMVGLGDLPGGTFMSEAFGVNADGSVVVGYSESASGWAAFRWLEGTDEGSGMRSIADLLTEDGVDLGTWVLEKATAVSDDGRVIVGYGVNPVGSVEAWKAVIGTGLVSVDDFANSIGAMHASVKAAHGIARSQLALTLNAARHPDRGKPQGRKRSATNVWSSLRFASGDYGVLSASGTAQGRGKSIWMAGGTGWKDTVGSASDTLVGSFGVTRHVTPGLRFGVRAHIGEDNLSIPSAEGNESERSTFGLDGYMSWEREGSPLRVYVGATTTRLADDLERGYQNGIEPVVSEGERDGLAHGGAFVLGLAYPAGRNATFMPFAGYEATRITLDGHTETSGPFPAVYDSVAVTTQVAMLGAEVTIPWRNTMEVWGSLARTYRFDDQLPGISGHVPLLSTDFAFAGGTLEQDWTEVQVGFSGQIRKNIRLNLFFDAALDGENDPRYGATIGLNIRL